MSAQKFVAVYPWTQQTGPETWRSVSRTLVISRETSVGEIVDWIEAMGTTKFDSVEITCDENTK